MRWRKILAGTIMLWAAAGCGSEKSTDGDSKPDPVTTAAVSSQPSASATTTAVASASASAKPVDKGPMVTIPAGTFKAGSRCHDIPRVRPNELEYENITMGEYQIDTYPYPNKPGEPAMLNVSRTKAAELCEAQGKRLCTEMEWERACKGPESTTFMWGNGFKKNQCDGQKDHVIGQRENCETKFGVKDMVGISIEWTASDWDRGTTTGDAVVHGARAEKVSWLSARCAHSRKRDPNKEYDNVGFRCCSGKKNTAGVSLRYKEATPIVEDPGIDTDFEMSMMKRLPRDHRGIVGVELSFDQVYRWHPVPKEEMIIARWKALPKEGKPYYEIAVFKMCGGAAWLSAKMRGPVEEISKPKVGVSPRKLSFSLKTGGQRGTLSMRYWHGHVKMEHPGWLKKGNSLDGHADTGVDEKKAVKGAIKNPGRFFKKKR